MVVFSAKLSSFLKMSKYLLVSQLENVFRDFNLKFSYFQIQKYILKSNSDTFIVLIVTIFALKSLTD